MMNSISLLLSFLLLQCLPPIFQCEQDPWISASSWSDANIIDFIEDDYFFEILYPEELQYTYRLRRARDFGVRFKQQFKGVRMVLADPFECCSLPYNHLDLRGAVALVTRGECSFVSKAIKAEEAGALAVIVTDNNTENDEIYIEMVDDNTQRSPSIPAAFLLGKSGYMIAKVLVDAHEDSAIINIPVNLSTVAISKLNQPPWIVW